MRLGAPWPCVHPPPSPVLARPAMGLCPRRVGALPQKHNSGRPLCRPQTAKTGLGATVQASPPQSGAGCAAAAKTPLTLVSSSKTQRPQALTDGGGAPSTEDSIVASQPVSPATSPATCAATARPATAAKKSSGGGGNWLLAASAKKQQKEKAEHAAAEAAAAAAGAAAAAKAAAAAEAAAAATAAASAASAD